MSYHEDEAPDRWVRSREILNKLERMYLSAIRAIALLAATLLVIYAIWLAASGTYKASRDVNSVKEVPVTVTPEEVANISLRDVAKSGSEPTSDPLASAKKYYADFTKRYYELFKAKFEPFKKPDDQPLSQKAFESRYVQTNDRLAALKDGSVDFGQDQADLESLLTTMTAVASDQNTNDRLRAYKAAKKTPVSHTETGTREETYCSYYGFYTGGCLSYDTRTVPYKRTVQQMKLPAGIVSHTDLFGAYQDAYLSKLSEKRQSNAAAAESQRAEILADNINGRARLWTALTVVGGFLALMFLFLLIALERHQRKIAASVHAEE